MPDVTRTFLAQTRKRCAKRDSASTDAPEIRHLPSKKLSHLNVYISFSKSWSLHFYLVFLFNHQMKYELQVEIMIVDLFVDCTRFRHNANPGCPGMLGLLIPPRAASL